MKIPSVLNTYNVYDNIGNKLIGVANELELPELEAMTDDVDGSGVLGVFADPATGQFESTEMNIKWKWMDARFFRIARTATFSQFTIRGSQQVTDPKTGNTDYWPLKIVVRGKMKNMKLGTLAKAKNINPETVLEVLYLNIKINKEPRLLLDKLNFRYEVNGVDMMKKIRKQV